MRKRFAFLLALGTLGIAATVGFGAATAAPLPENCTKEKGTVTCVTTEGPGKNQAGVGCTETSETKGNTTNKSPEPQNLEDTEEQKPPKSQGAPAC